MAVNVAIVDDVDGMVGIYLLSVYIRLEKNKYTYKASKAMSGFENYESGSGILELSILWL